MYDSPPSGANKFSWRGRFSGWVFPELQNHPADPTLSSNPSCDSRDALSDARPAQFLKRTPMLRFILLSSSFCLLPIVAVAQLRPAPKDDAPPAESKFSLTIYSTADPATFDPQQTAHERQ